MKKTALFQIIVFIITFVFIQAAYARKYPMIPVITGIESLFDVWGTSARNVYAVGQSGTILHYDGETLTPMSGVQSLLCECLPSEVSLQATRKASFALRMYHFKHRKGKPNENMA